MRRPRRRTALDISPAEWAFVNGDPWPLETRDFERWSLEFDGPRRPGHSVRELWEEWGQQILGRWTAERPGSRPSLWWRFDAPAMAEVPACWADAYFTGELREPRRRLGGRGTPAHEAFECAPSFSKGIPTGWVWPEDVESFEDLEDADGAPAVAFDPEDPPRFESEAAYLDRLGLLTPTERRRLDRDGWPPDEVVAAEELESEGDVA